MTLRWRCRAAIGWVLGSCLAVGPEVKTVAAPPASPALVQAGGMLARPPIEEGWAQVITITDEWIILENDRGQQYPVAIDSVSLLIVRWPTTFDRISPTALVEVTGVDLGSNTVQTDHIDVYEGAARSLVTPTFFSTNGNGIAMTPFDFTFNASAYGAPFPGLDMPIQGGAMMGPPQIHAVGTLAGLAPLRVATPANIVVSVLPSPGGMSISQVTAGTPGVIRPGDLVYFAVSAITPKTLVLARLIVLKAQPMDQFVR